MLHNEFSMDHMFFIERKEGKKGKGKREIGENGGNERKEEQRDGEKRKSGGRKGRVKKEMGERDCESSENKTPGH